MSKIHNKIINGDCLNELKKIPDKSFDLVFADPPYNMQIGETLTRPDASKVNGVDDKWDQFNSFKHYDDFCKAWLIECKRILKDNGSIWVIGSYHNIFRLGYHLQNLDYWNNHDDPDTINFVDTKFKNGLINYYIIAAIKNDMSAVYSNVVIIDLRNPEDQVITLNGEYKNNEVILNWKKPNKPVKYYRVIRSSTNPFPTYPQDSYIKTFTNINDTTYTDLDTLKDEYNYYGITIIFGDNSIGYSNPIKIEYV